jgi:hypothetical protein
VKTENILFIEGKEKLNWCISQALQSNCFEALVVYGQAFSERDLRRFQLLSERNQSHVFLLTERFHQSWVPQLQLKIYKQKEKVKVDIHRQRGFA